jgi:integrase
VLDQIARGAVVAVIPNPRPPDPYERDDRLVPVKRWYSMQEVADMVGYGLSKVKMLAPVEPRNFNRRWDARISAAGVPRITVHGARTTCGSLLVDLDVHPRVAMKILRHAQFALTMEIYSEASSEATREALKRLGEVLRW